jgi:hypothetical protein
LTIRGGYVQLSLPGPVALGRILPRLFEYEFSLGPGQERDFGPFNSRPGATLRVFSSAVPIHYVGAFDAPFYLQARQRGGRFPFAVGTGKAGGHRLEFQTGNYGQFYVVVRASLWNVGLWPYRVWAEYG